MVTSRPPPSDVVSGVVKEVTRVNPIAFKTSRPASKDCFIWRLNSSRFPGKIFATCTQATISPPRCWQVVLGVSFNLMPRGGGGVPCDAKLTRERQRIVICRLLLEASFVVELEVRDDAQLQLPPARGDSPVHTHVLAGEC